MCLGTTERNQNFIKEENKTRWNSGNASLHSVQNLLPFRLLTRDVYIKMYKIIISSVAVYGCETWSLILMEEYRLRMLENRVPRKIFGPKKNEMPEGWNERLRHVYSSLSLMRITKERSMRWAGHVARVGYKRNARSVETSCVGGAQPLGSNIILGNHRVGT
jgi:hypothetical protein